MVDKRLPKYTGTERLGDRPLRWLFLDLNAYFAAVEQAEDPNLRGRPIAVAPTEGDSATCIAASYEAKKFGVKTGTKTGDARRMCPEIILVPARPKLYVHYHRQILAAVEQVLPIDKVCSIDEMKCRLLGEETHPDRARALARQIKQAILDSVAPNLTSSVGIAPNSFLAKLATDLEKPDGLVVLESHGLPDRLRGLKLTEFTGINRRMEARLMAAGIFRSDDLIDRSPAELVRAFGSKNGERWWYLLRGYEMEQETETGKSLGHSYVLPPDLRHDAACRDVMLRLLHKACARLRQDGFWASHISVGVSGMAQSWHAEARLEPTQETLEAQSVALRLWESRHFARPLKVSVTFTGLKRAEAVTPSLFAPEAVDAKVGRAVDAVNQKFGKNQVYLASLAQTKDHASEKIAFQKTWLFAEGKGDQEWVDTRRAKTDPDPLT